MSNSINTNVASSIALRSLSSSGSAVQTAMQRLSSGYRINYAKDDSAGLAIAERMNTQVRGFQQAQRNAQDGISMVQVAEGALAEVGDMMQRMRELAVQASNGIYSSSDRANLNAEYKSLATELERTLESTEFNGKAIIAGDAAEFVIQVGAKDTSANQLTISMANMTVSLASVINGSLGSANTTAALGMLDKLDTGIDAVTKMRAKLGAAQIRLEYSVRSLSNNAETQMAARGRIVDADFGMETATLARAQIQQQAAIAMSAQASKSQQIYLALLN